MPIEIVGCFITVLALIYTNSGGIGGGGIMIPVCIAFFGFDVKSAIGMSNATVAVSSVIRYV